MTLKPDNEELTAEESTGTAIPQTDEAIETPPASQIDNPDDNAEPTVDSPEPVAADEATEADDTDETGLAEEAGEADVEFDGERPLVKELEYQAPKLKFGAEEEEPQDDARFSSVAEARAVVEGFLFSSNEPLSVSRLSKLMGNLHPKTVRGLLLELQWEYENRAGALQVVEIAGGYQMSTRPFVAPWMFRLHKLKRRSPLSPATLETLAIIAYRQPITKGEIEAIRGVETGAPIRTLQELGLIEASGRREVIGRPQLYVTTEQFLKVFGLKSIADLPSISELKSRFAEDQKLKPKVAAPVAPPEEVGEPNQDNSGEAQVQSTEPDKLDEGEVDQADVAIADEVPNELMDDTETDSPADDSEDEEIEEGLAEDETKA